MAANSNIEWTDATWNPITGCTLVSEGCRHRYAARIAATRLKNHPSRKGLARLNASGEAKFTGEVRFNKQWLCQPLEWRRPRNIFVCAHGDLFHEGVPDAWIDQVFAVMALCHQHTFQVLTKRPERMRKYLYNQPLARRRWETVMRRDHGCTTRCPAPILKNVWLGVSVEDQATADVRIPVLLATPAAVRFVSAEPLLGPVDFNDLTVETASDSSHQIDALTCEEPAEDCCSDPSGTATLDWVIVGGESGSSARPMHPEWVRSIRDQCKGASVAFHFKQWGAWAPGENAQVFTGYRNTATWFANQWSFQEIDMSDPEASWMDEPDVYRVGKKVSGRTLDGVTHDFFPGSAA